MADLSKLKRNRLGPPPPVEEASSNLSAPEVIGAGKGAARPARTPPPRSMADTARHMATRIDGRSLRRTNRVVPLALRVTPEFDERLRVLAARDRLLLAEVLERALAAYEQQLRP
jgi:hypothetical protein